MPLGISRLTSLSRYVAASSGGGSEAVYSLTSSTFNASAYTNNRLSYAGDDSSGQPVFYYAYDNGGGQFHGSLLKINNDGTVSETVTTYAPFDCYDGQGVIAYDTNSNPLAVANMVGLFSGTIRCKMFTSSIDLDNLTFGTVYNKQGWNLTTPNAGITSITYTGTPGNVLATYRNGGARVHPIYVTATGIGPSNIENQINAIGDGVWQNFSDQIFYDSTNNQWCYGLSNGNANQTVFGKHQSTYNYYNKSEAVYDNISVGLAQTEVYKLNDTTFLALAAKDAAAQAVAYSVTWGTSAGTAPSASAGSTMTFTDNSSWNEGFACAVDSGTETAYVLYNDGTDWNITSITHSGTALTEGTPTAVGVTTTNWNPCTSNAACVADSAQGLMFVAIIDDSTSSNPQLYVKPLA